MGSNNAFFTFASNKKLFLKQMSENKTLRFLWRKNRLDSTEDTVNAKTTLPIPLAPRTRVYNDTRLRNNNTGETLLKLKQIFAYGKVLVGFYKEGAKNAWNNGLEQRRLVSSGFKVSDETDNAGNVKFTSISNFNKMVSQMAQTIYMSKVENDIFNRSIDTGIVRNDVPKKSIDTGLFNLLRSQFQLLKRTPKDFYRLPLFLVVLSIFFEMTPIVCYAIPEIACETCLLPTFLPRVWNDKARTSLLSAKKDCGQEEKVKLSLQNAYSLAPEDARLLCKSLRLISRYVPVRMYPGALLRERLQRYYRYLMVDNYYLCGLNNEGKSNIWNLSQQELLVACLERNLIVNLKEDLEKIEVIGNTSVNEIRALDYFTILRMRLLLFLVNFENRNIGYLLIAPFVEPSLDWATIFEWWKESEEKCSMR